MSIGLVFRTFEAEPIEEAKENILVKQAGEPSGLVRPTLNDKKEEHDEHDER